MGLGLLAYFAASGTYQITLDNRPGTISSSAMLRRETDSYVADGAERRKLLGHFLIFSLEATSS
jgi:hypothetical protein